MANIFIISKDQFFEYSYLTIYKIHLIFMTDLYIYQPFKLYLQAKMKRLILLSVGIATTYLVHAQHVCGSEIHRLNLANKHVELRISEEKRPTQIAEFQKQYKSVQKRATKYTIPVVFHVVHTNGENNISREQILDQMRILNEDFNFSNSTISKLRSPFQNVVGSADINFVLAEVDPNGKCFDGINRVESTVGLQMDMDKEPVKDLVYWDYKKYLNIWVVDNIVSSNSSGGTVLGYAVFPSFAKFTKDGIVVRHDRVGTIGTGEPNDMGRTLTHEVGHWLGLYHTFQDGCNGGDYCGDTPPVASTFTNAGCPTNGNSCSNDKPDLPDMWENFMDYSKGNCMSVFTFDQIAIMRGELQSSPRGSNVTASNLLATGVTKSSVTPVAEFNSNTRVICAGSPVQFFDLSCKGEPTVRSWTFTGASTPSSSDVNPTVIYQTPGVYTVSLLAQNSKGTNTIKKDNYITVLPKNGTLIPNYEESFEGEDPIKLGFKHLSPSPYQFAVTNKAAFTGTKSFVANIATGSNNVGNLYTFVTPNIDMSKIPGGTGGKMTFYCSYTQPNANTTEVLRIYASDDCGATFNKIYERSGTALSYTGASYATNWVPTSPSHWKRHGLANLDNLGYGNKTNVIFKFEIQSNGGNPVYIDNINIGQWYAGENTLENESFDVQLYPNPANDFATFSVNSKMASPNATIELFDYAGRRISVIYQGAIQLGKQDFTISAPANNQNGIYFVKLTTEIGTYSRTIIFSAQ